MLSLLAAFLGMAPAWAQGILVLSAESVELPAEAFYIVDGRKAGKISMQRVEAGSRRLTLVDEDDGQILATVASLPDRLPPEEWDPCRDRCLHSMTIATGWTREDGSYAVRQLGKATCRRFAEAVCDLSKKDTRLQITHDPTFEEWARASGSPLALQVVAVARVQ